MPNVCIRQTAQEDSARQRIHLHGDDGLPLRDSSIEGTTKRLWQAAKVCRFTAHDLRHTDATKLAEDGARASDISEALDTTPQIARRYQRRGSRRKKIAERQARIFDDLL